MQFWTNVLGYLLNKNIANHEFVICQDKKWHRFAKRKRKEQAGTTANEGVHSLCQNKNAHSLGLSHLKRLQFHTMFDVYDHSVDWMCILTNPPHQDFWSNKQILSSLPL